MSGKISIEWDEDIYGNSLLLVRKNRGKLNLDEVLDAIRYDWRIQGHYVMILNATEATCGVGGICLERRRRERMGTLPRWKKEKKPGMQ